jgi:hypothetical protein
MEFLMRFARLSVLFFCSLMFSLSSWAMTEAEIIKSLSLPENSTGNIADAIEEATGARGWMSADMKPMDIVDVVGENNTVFHVIIRTL